MVGEVQNNAVTQNYLRGINLIRREAGTVTDYYLFNAHGDVVNLVNTAGVVTQSYDYDAFGVEKDPDPLDTNHFRYCGEYLDAEAGRYYLRARYYDPLIGRFTQRDTHWNTANMIYGDNPQKINEREDKLGLKHYSYAPQLSAVVQSGNLYVYCANDPVMHIDSSGHRTKKASDKLISNNKYYILNASKLFGVDPAILAAVIYAEQRLNVNLIDDLVDGICGFYGILDTSIGVAQVKVSTAKFIEACGYMRPILAADGGWSLGQFGFIHGTETMARVKFLEASGTSIFYAAAYLRYFIDIWSEIYPEISFDVAILATLYNLGHNQTAPNDSPQANPFGRFAADNYLYMKVLLGLEN